MRPSDVKLAQVLNELSRAVERDPLTPYLPKADPRPFPPEVLSRAKRLNLAQLTIAEVRAAGWAITLDVDKVGYAQTGFSVAVSSSVTRAVKMLKAEIREVLLTEGKA